MPLHVRGNHPATTASNPLEASKQASGLGDGNKEARGVGVYFLKDRIAKPMENWKRGSHAWTIADAHTPRLPRLADGPLRFLHEPRGALI